MMEINFQQHWEVSRGGIAESGINTEDFVSKEKCSQLKFIIDLLCNISLSDKVKVML